MKIVTGTEILTEPPAGTTPAMASYFRRRCRTYCARTGLALPEWANARHEYKVELRAHLKEPAVITKYKKYKARETAEILGVDVPEWAKKTVPRDNRLSAISRRKPYFDRKMALVGVMTEVSLALWSGMDSYWQRAKALAEQLGEPALVALVTAKSDKSYDEAKGLVLSIDPIFGRHKDDTTETKFEYHKQWLFRRRAGRPKKVKAKSDREQTEAWEKFCRENDVPKVNKAVYMKIKHNFKKGEK